MRLRVTSFALLLALAVVLSAQIQQRTYDLRHVSFWLSFDEGSRSIDAKVVNNISVLKDGTTVVAFGAGA